MEKCTFADGIRICPDGVNDLDPCVYEDVKMYTNCTVIVSKCVNCGHAEFSWVRQEDTEEIDLADPT